jgi:hypothetical protein
LHLYGIRGFSTLQLGDDEPSSTVEPEDVQAILLWTSGGEPVIELERHDHHSRPEDLWVLDNPSLKVLTLLQCGLRQRDSLDRACFSSRHLENDLVRTPRGHPSSNP